MNYDGILLINKSEGYSSRYVDDLIKKKFNFKKTGHLGTLDPFAEGLLIIAVNKATKLLPFIEDLKKEYICELKFGILTDTFDKTGKILENKAINSFDEDDIKRTFDNILKLEEQIPPIYSAIKYNGKKLYEYALKKENIELEKFKRKIKIYSIELLNFTNNSLRFKCLVSKGTYIRSLAIEIAKQLNNNICYVDYLCRTSIGQFNLNSAKKIEEISIENLINYNCVPLNYYKYKVLSNIENDIKNGKRILLNDLDQNIKEVLLINEKNEYLAIYKKEKNNIFKSVRGLF